MDQTGELLIQLMNHFGFPVVKYSNQERFLGSIPKGVSDLSIGLSQFQTSQVRRSPHWHCEAWDSPPKPCENHLNQMLAVCPCFRYVQAHAIRYLHPGFMAEVVSFVKHQGCGNQPAEPLEKTHEWRSFNKVVGISIHGEPPPHQ